MEDAEKQRVANPSIPWKPFMHSRLTPLASALHSLALGVSLVTASHCAMAASNGATTQTQTRHYQIAPGSLDSVLGAFGQQSALMIAADAALTRGVHSNGLSGSYSFNEALERLLAPLNLQGVPDAGGYRVVARPPSAAGELELQSTQVSANQLGTITEGSGSYTPGTIATATRLVLTPRETPQSISVVTRQVMDDFGLDSIDDVMRHTPGITVSTYDTERTNYYARGFSIQNFQYDGIPTLRDAQYSAGQTLSDMALYDRVEVLKGATGLLTGAGAPGGTINLIRKKPTYDFQGHVDVGAGSWDNYRTEVDVSGPLTESGNVRARAVAAYQDKHSFMDHYSRKTSVYYGVLEADLTPDTLLTVGADYQDNDPKGSSWTGSRTVYDSEGNSISLPRSFNNGPKWSAWEQYTRTAFATLEHTFASGWVAKAQYNHQINGYNAPLGYVSPDTPTVSSIYSRKYVGETTSDSLDVYTSGPFQLLGREHQLVLGQSLSRSHWKNKSYNDVTYFDNAYDYESWDGDAIEPAWGSVTSRDNTTTRQTGTYLTARFSLMDDLSLMLGSRLASYQVTGTSDSQESGKVVPYAGLVYDLNDNFSAYASYTEIFYPQIDYRDSNDKMLEPDEGNNYEVGVKGEFFNGRLNTSLAYFEVHESNRPEADAAYNANPTNPGVDYAYTGIQSKTKGYEAEVSGELTPGWQLQAGYTHKVSRDQSGTKVSTWEPEDQLSFYTSYKLSGPLDKLTVGGGARWQGEGWQILNNRSKGTQERFSQDPFWVVDLMARYQITDKLSASLNVYNLFDKYYYTNIGFYNSSYYGDPRNVMLSTRWDF
jgi:outer membrane receptor for ferric coprogen and ferric-rhodotorulic acid